MNLNILSIATMIAITKFWLTDTRARVILMANELGRAYVTQLRLAYTMLLQLQMRSTDASAAIKALSATMHALDNRHDNKARAVYHHLIALRAGTEDPAVAAECTELLERFFPEQLQIINRSYVEEGGWAETMSEQMTPELRERLASITVGEQTLEELFDAWLTAGTELSHNTLMRTRLKTEVASTGASDAAINRRDVRYRWIRTVQIILKSVDMLELSDEQFEALFTPLKDSVLAAEQRAENGEPASDDGEPVSDTSGDEPVGDTSGDEPVGDTSDDGGIDIQVPPLAGRDINAHKGDHDDSELDASFAPEPTARTAD